MTATPFRLINAESNLKQIKRNLFLASVNYYEIEMLVQQHTAFIGAYIAKRTDSIHPSQLSLLKNVRDDFELLRTATQQKNVYKMRPLFELLLGKYTSFSLTNSSYLLRHPEKMDKDFVGEASSAGRELTREGVKQAKGFADMLEEEILLSALPVRIELSYSPFKRTRLFAEIIRLKLNTTKQMYEKNITITTNEDQYISGNLLKISDEKLSTWAVSSNGKEVSDAVQHWFAGKTDSSQSVIYIGITHLPNIAAFLVNALKIPSDRAENFHYADYIKNAKKRYYYEGTWLP